MAILKGSLQKKEVEVEEMGAQIGELASCKEECDEKEKRMEELRE